MRGKGCEIGLVLMAALTAACARPTPELAFQTKPCPDLEPHQRETLKPTFWTEHLEKVPTILTDTPLEIGNLTVRVGSLRWTCEYFSSYYRKTFRSECPWLYYEWEVRKTRNIPWMRDLDMDSELHINLYLAIGTWAPRADAAEGCETWDPDPARKGEVGEGKRCRFVIHVRPEWGPRWLVISQTVSFIPPLFMRIARVEVPPPPPAPER